MTVSSTTAKVSYTGNGTTQAFAVPFYFLADSQLLVILRLPSGAESVQVLGSNYTVAGAGVLTGGTVTMNVAPATGATLIIARNVPLTQETDLQPNDRLPAETLEQSIDKLTMITQQLDEAVDRSLKFPVSDSTTLSGTLPNSTNRASKLLGFDIGGSPIALAQSFPEVNVLAYFTEEQRNKIIAGTTDFDCTAGIEAAIATLKTVYLPAGLYKCNINITNRTIIRGDGSTATIVKPWNDAIASMTYKYAAMSNPAPLDFWTYHSQIRDIGFGFNSSQVGVGFAFSNTTLSSPPIQNWDTATSGGLTAAGPADQYVNNVSFYNCHFFGLNKGVQFSVGNIGTEFYSCGFSNNYYGVYTISNKFGGDAMHGGNKYFYGGMFTENVVGVYIHDTSTYGAVNFYGTIFEVNKIAMYAYNSQWQVCPIALYGCWFEFNGVTLNGVSENVTIDAWSGPVPQTATTVSMPKRSWIFEGDRAAVVFDACGVVADINCLAVNSHITLRDCQTERTVGTFSGGACTVDSTSVIINDSPRSEGGLLVDDRVITTGYVRLGLPSIDDLPGPFQPLRARSRWFFVDPRSGIQPSMKSLVASETFTSPYTLKDGVGGSPLTGSMVEDGRVFTNCNEFTKSAFTTSEFLGLYDTQFGVAAGWYAFTIDVKVVTCDDLESLKFYLWNQNQGGEFASMVYEARIPALDTWFTMAAYAYLPDPLAFKMYFDVQGPTAGGTDTVWRMSAFQAHRFTTLDQCVSFLKTGAYSSKGIVMSASGDRIVGDFSNSTVPNRTLFQTRTNNSATRVGAIPRGTSNIASFIAFNNSSATDCAAVQVRINNTSANILSDITGTASYLPLDFSTNGFGRMRIDTTGSIGIGNEVGGGGTVQANSLFTAGGVYKEDGNNSFVYNTGGTFPATATSAARVYRSNVATEAASFTIPTLYHFEAVGTTLGAGSAVTTEVAFFGNLAAASGKWNVYASGTARNFFAGGIEVAAGATNMAAGFTHIPAAAGAPTGAPTNPTGNVPMYYDSTNHKIYVYSGGTWRSTAALT
jgi:hypothetical protein